MANRLVEEISPSLRALLSQLANWLNFTLERSAACEGDVSKPADPLRRDCDEMLASIKSVRL